MSVTLRLLACCAGLVMLAACVESELPLSNLMQSAVDPRLYGVWSRTEADGEVQYIHMGCEKSEPLDPKRTEPEPGLMCYWGVAHGVQKHTVDAPMARGSFAPRSTARTSPVG